MNSAPRKICFITGSRAEYGILSPIMRAVATNPDATLQMVATNMHLSPAHGMTVREIEADGFTVDRRVEMMLDADTPSATVKSMGVELIGMSDTLSELAPDIIVILGDRYEMLAAASAALILGIPVAHIHGGEITEGAYDDAIRHAITKLSYLHFAATDEYRNRIIQMGENPARVFNTGAPGIDGIETIKGQPFDCPFTNFALITFHPVTKEPGEARAQTQALLDALDNFSDLPVIFTMPNSDAGGREIAALLRNWTDTHSDRAHAYTSLGRARYVSALRQCSAVIGNSSSGIIEAPSFGVPTVNIGNRQQGRTQGNTIINCPAETEAIKAAIEKALSPEFRKYVANQGTNPYHKTGSVEAIAGILANHELAPHAVKHFHDLTFEQGQKTTF